MKAPGWYPDPWQVAPWRWWDGDSWTPHIAGNQERKPRLPAALSVPVVVCGFLSLLVVIALAAQAPVAVLLGLVPLVIVGPVLHWLDRVEPEPWSARVHALLWGATVAAMISGIVNSLVQAAFGATAAAVISAPLIEEVTKALAILYAVRRRELDGVMDGIVYAGWVALGFAVAEDFLYFAAADQSGLLVQVFILRAVLTPFAHPLFTAWTGLAIGRAVARHKSAAAGLLWGLPLAVGAHMAWNGSLTLGERENGAPVLGLSILLFVLLFVVGSLVLLLVRRRDEHRFIELVPWLAQRYQMAPEEIALFGSWSTMLSARRSLSKSQRRDFDGVHAALARLAHLHDQPGPTDPVDEQVLVAQLQQARRAQAH